MKDEDTGIDDEPPVKMYIRGVEQWRFEDELVPERTQWKKFYFRNHDRLLLSQEPLDEIPPRSFTQDPPNVCDEIGRVRYATNPMTEEREFTGPAAVRFHASIDTRDTTWMVYLHDRSPEGERETLSRGYLRASHRRIDEEESKPYRPYHPHEDPEPVTPGEIYEYKIALPPIATQLKQEHQLELEIRSMEIPFSETSDLPPGSHHLPHTESITHKVYNDAARPSYLLLPEIPYTDTSRWIESDSDAHPGPIL